MGRRERRKEQRKKALMSYTLAAIMIMSLAGVFIGNYSGDSASAGGISLSYEGFDFDVVNSQYVTEVNEKTRSFVFHPIDTSIIDISPEILRSLSATPVVVVTFNPESEDLTSSELARYQMEVNLDQTVYSAITSESEIYDYPIITCLNATPQFPVVSIDVTNETGEIKYENGCVVITGNGLDVVKITERVIYGMLGVVNG